MSKKMLSLALALVLCLGLTVPASAVGQAGSTTIDEQCGTVTLSNPILYTVSRADMETIDMTSMDVFIEGEPYDKTLFGPVSDYLDENFFSQMSTVYAVPEGTAVTLPNNVVSRTIFELDVTWENEICHATEFDVINYPGSASVGLKNGGYVVGVELEYTEVNESVASGGSGASGSAIGDGVAGTIFFYVPKKGTTSTDNPFSSAATAPSKATFTDVAANAYYADAVAWAVDETITSGTSATTFSPNETCTVGQILTFLWRANGSPEPAIKNPFSNIKENDYYYKALLWAKEKGIINATKEGTFGANAPCTRGSAVFFMWGAAGAKIDQGAMEKQLFDDVPLEKWSTYVQPVYWAVKNGVTSGTSATTFSPDQTCTRGQIVTFLYRAYGK